MTKDELTKLGIPAELHDDPTLKEAKDVPTVFKMLVDTKAFVGSSIRIPGKDAGEEAHKEFRAKLKERVPTLIDVPVDEKELEVAEASIYERLGLPKDVKGYPTLTDLKINVPDGVKIDEEKLRAEAMGLKLTRKQFAVMAAEAVKRVVQDVQASGERRKALRAELGEAFEERLLQAAATAKKLGEPDDVVEAVKSGTIDPATAKRWINIAKAMGTEIGDLGGSPGSGSNKLTPSEAQVQINEIMANPALWDESAPTHKDLKAKVERLHAIAYPGANE